MCSDDDDSFDEHGNPVITELEPPCPRPPINNLTIERIAFLVWADAGWFQVNQYSDQALTWMSWIFINRYIYNLSGRNIDMDTAGTPWGLKRVGHPYPGIGELEPFIDAAIKDLMNPSNQDYQSFMRVLGIAKNTYIAYSEGRKDPTQGALFFTVVNQDNTVAGKHFDTITDSMDYLSKWSYSMAVVYTPARAASDNAIYPFTFGFSDVFTVDGIQSFIYVSNNNCSSVHACQPNFSNQIP